MLVFLRLRVIVPTPHYMISLYPVDSSEPGGLDAGKADALARVIAAVPVFIPQSHSFQRQRGCSLYCIGFLELAAAAILIQDNIQSIASNKH